MDKAPVFVGIDVSKRRLDLHLRPAGESFAIDYGEEEVTALVERLLPLAPTLVVLEATGGLEVRLALGPGRGRPAGRGGQPAPGPQLCPGVGMAGQDRPPGCRGDRSFRRGGPATGASLAGRGDPPFRCPS